MVSLKARAESLGRTEAEIKSEMAAALGRIGSSLASLVADLHQLKSELQTVSESERSKKSEQYRALRSQAKLYQWYLTVQREAIGIRNHESLRELYPIPGDDLR